MPSNQLSMKLIAYLRAASKSSVSFAEKRKALFHLEQHFFRSALFDCKGVSFYSYSSGKGSALFYI